MKLSSREKVLAGVVGAAVFIVFTLVLGKVLINRQAALRVQLAARDRDLKSMQQLLSQRDLWAKRDAWLTQKQPKLTNENSAGVQLLEQIRTIAKNQNVTLENPAFGQMTKSQWYRSVPVNLETKSGWGELIHFLAAVQQPEQFIVLESVDIAIDATDQSKMRGKFRIARWYAP